MVIIIHSITIGESCILGDGSVVTKNVSPNCIYAGNPARFICSIVDHKNKCLESTLDYDISAYHENKKDVI